MAGRTRRAAATMALTLSVAAVTGCVPAVDRVAGTLGVNPTGSASASVPADPTAPATTVAPNPAVPTQGAPRPNFFLITVDDAAPGDIKHMPNVQRMIADQGVTLDNAIAPTPICVPARATLLTGQYAHNHGALTIQGDNGGFNSFNDAATLPEWLQDAGYDTYFTGKYLNGYGQGASHTYVPPGWTGWNGSLDPTTYNYSRTELNRNGRITATKRYNTDEFRDRIATTLSAGARQDKPWYLWANYVAPHFGGPRDADDPTTDKSLPRKYRLTSPSPAPRDKDSFKGLRLPKKPDMFVHPKGSNVKKTKTHWSKRGKAALREMYQQRIESLQAVDRAVGKHLRILRRTGQLKDTVVVFTSDNGYNVGEHNMMGKLWYFNTSLEVPMVVRGPGIAKDKTISTVVTHADLPVTFAELAGATPTRVVDGVNVAGILAGRTSAPERVVPIEAWPVRTNFNRRFYTGVRVGESWTYASTTKYGEEMYDLRKDPHMLRNVIDSPAYAAQANRLRSLTEQYQDCAGDTCPDLHSPRG